MMKMLLHWVLSALAIWMVSRLVPGFEITGIGAALIAAVFIGFINATLGLFLKVITFPLTILTLGGIPDAAVRNNAIQHRQQCHCDCARQSALDSR